MSSFKALGQRVTPEDASELETFPTPPLVERVLLATEEFTSVCPVTRQPDYGNVTVEYEPGQRCLESKSLKLYLMRYRNAGVFCEALAAEICGDLVAALMPRRLTVTVGQRPRGGIAIASTATYPPHRAAAPEATRRRRP